MIKKLIFEDQKVQIKKFIKKLLIFRISKQNNIINRIS